MRRETGDPKWDYDPIDVMDFLISQFKEGGLVEALDADSHHWRKGRILKVPQRQAMVELVDFGTPNLQ